MSKIDDGGAAIDLRDYFAAKAMAAMITTLAMHDGMPLVVRDDVVADRSYDFADAMLAARKSREPEDWIEWNGGECPVPEGASFFVRFRDGAEFDVGTGKGLIWHHEGTSADIIAYRIVSNGDSK